MLSLQEIDLVRWYKWASRRKTLHELQLQKLTLRIRQGGKAGINIYLLRLGHREA